MYRVRGMSKPIKQLSQAEKSERAYVIEEWEKRARGVNSRRHSTEHKGRATEVGGCEGRGECRAQQG